MNKFILIILNFCFLKWASGQGSKCSRGSHCTYLDECPPILSLIKEDSNTLLNYYCGYKEGNGVSVCCPIEVSNVPGPSDSCGFREHPKNFPWITKIGTRHLSDPSRGPALRCSGVLISIRYIISTSLCVRQRSGERTIAVVENNDPSLKLDCFGEGINELCIRPTVEIEVEESIPYPGSSELFDAIGLMRLVEHNYILTPICLPPPGLKLSTSESVIAAGWTLLPTLKFGNNIVTVSEVQFGDESKCQTMFRERYNSSTDICVEDLCQDSGSPLMLAASAANPWIILGISSYGFPNCKPHSNSLAGYSRISRYSQWILNNIKL